MASYNRVILLGNITRDPELRFIPNGMAVVDIGLAVNDRRKDASGNWFDEPTFVDVTLFGRNAEIVCEYTKKGSPILIEGRLKMDTWETDGQKRSKIKVIGERVNLVGGRNQNAGDGQSSGRPGGYSQPSQGAYNSPSGNYGPSSSNNNYGSSNTAGGYGNGTGNFENAPASPDVPPEDDIPF